MCLCRCLGTLVQIRKGLSKILSVHLLVGGALELDFPSVGRRRRGRNEVELAGVGEVEVFVSGLGGRGLAEVDLDGDAHDLLAVEDLADAHGRVLIHEGDDNAAE